MKIWLRSTPAQHVPVWHKCPRSAWVWLTSGVRGLNPPSSRQSKSESSLHSICILNYIFALSRIGSWIHFPIQCLPLESLCEAVQQKFSTQLHFALWANFSCTAKNALDLEIQREWHIYQWIISFTSLCELSWDEVNLCPQGIWVQLHYLLTFALASQKYPSTLHNLCNWHTLFIM